MRNTLVATVVVAILATGLIGCKTAPKLAWWKTGEKSDVESTALAHSAPSLPADVAKQAESLATTTPSIDLTAPATATPSGAAPAPAFTPSAAAVASAPVAKYGTSTPTTPAAYPSTGASSYAPSTAPQVAAATPNVPPMIQSSEQVADLGTLDMPYNPNAVPPAKNVAAATPPAVPKTSTDRYGSSSLVSTAPAFNPAGAPPVAKTTVPQLSGTDRYANVTTNTAPTTPAPGVNLASTNAVAPPVTAAPAYSASAPPASTAPTASLSGDRYAATMSAPPAVASVPQESPAVTAPAAPATTAPVVASTKPFRPGGTSSYESSAAGQPTVEIATRPKPVEPSVPNLTAPGATTEPAPAPRYR